VLIRNDTLTTSAFWATSVGDYWVWSRTTSD
jgi:hypothetical protein